MKVNILDAHDRLLEFKKQSNYISQGCLDCITNRPPEFENHPFYIFAHARTADDGVTKKLIWSPRLTKPKAQLNSMLFKAYPPSDKIKIIWMIPADEMWGQYKKGNLIEDGIISNSIHDYIYNIKKLEGKEIDDLSDQEIDRIYTLMRINASGNKLLTNLYHDLGDDWIKDLKPQTSEASSISLD